MKRLSISLVLAATLFLTSCSTVNVTRKDAELLRDNGNIEASNDVYRKLIAANPKHFQSVLYQHEIMLNSNASGDPQQIVNEIKRTVELFSTACNEHYEGATSEAIQQEYDALDKFISNQGKSFHIQYIKTKDPSDALTSKNIYEIYLHDLYKSFPVNDRRENYCAILYYNSDINYFLSKNDAFNFMETAANGYTLYLDECEPENLSNDYDLGEKKNWTDFYVDAAHGAVLAYHDETNECPSIPETPADAYEKGTFQKYPIDDCRMKFIHASQRFFEIAQAYGNVEQKEFALNALYYTGEIFFNHNQFEQAIPVFQTLIQIAPQEERAILAANYILEYFKLTKQYQAMQTTIQEFRNNPALMANTSPLMQEFILIMDSFEEQLNIRLEGAVY